MIPEEKARQKIEQILQDAGWTLQDHKDLNLGASLGVAVREFPVSTGYADYSSKAHYVHIPLVNDKLNGK